MRDERVPAAQLAPMWVSGQTPKLADRILCMRRGDLACVFHVLPVLETDDR
jgi:hypothetical protein